MKCTTYLFALTMTVTAGLTACGSNSFKADGGGTSGGDSKPTAKLDTKSDGAGGADEDNMGSGRDDEGARVLASRESSGNSHDAVSFDPCKVDLSGSDAAPQGAALLGWGDTAGIDGAEGQISLANFDREACSWSSEIDEDATYKYFMVYKNDNSDIAAEPYGKSFGNKNDHGECQRVAAAENAKLQGAALKEGEANADGASYECIQFVRGEGNVVTNI